MSAERNQLLHAYKDAGFRLVKVRHGEKRPSQKEWGKRKLEPESIAHDENVGLIFENGFIDLDFDTSEARKLSGFFFGELVWDAPFNKDRVPSKEWEDVHRSGALCALASLALKLYPAEGRRDDYCMKLAGALLVRFIRHRCEPALGSRVELEELYAEWRRMPVRIAKLWQNAEPKPEHFAPNDNIGVLLGAKSNGLLDLDFDIPQARALSGLHCF